MCRVDEIPAAFGGAARHAVRNALTASALAAALGLPHGAIGDGLRAFRSDPDDNPGRANVFSVDGATVVVDYAHNVHGLHALAAMSAGWPARRRVVLFGSAGDRSDADLAAMADALTAFGAERFVVTDLPDYLRGRPPGQTPAVLAAALRQRGVAADAVVTLDGPADGAAHALGWVGDGDLAVLVTLDQRDRVLALIREAGGTPRG